MKKSIKVSSGKERCILIPNIVFSQVPAFFGNTNRLLQLSLLLPRFEDAKRLPLIVWINGGAWIMMDKDLLIPEMVDFARHGYAIASIQYRVSGEGLFPAQIEDVKTAVRFLRTHAEKYGIDADRIGMMGESAGGHLAALAGTTGHVGEFDKGEWIEQSSKVQAVVDWYGPTDFMQMSKFPGIPDHDSPTAPEALLIGGPVQQNLEKCREANPITYITKETPPFLILHGDQDEIVPFNQSELLYEALIDIGAEATLYKLEGAGHATKEFFQPEIKTIITEFFDRHLKREK